MVTPSLLDFSAPMVLASRSPRRLHLLRSVGVEPIVHPSDAPEHMDVSLRPEELVRKLACQKAEHIAESFPRALVLGADTVVVLDGRVLGKPESPAEAETMLASLSGRTHTVFTGIALVHANTGRIRTEATRTEVTFAALSKAEIKHYVDGGSPMDKAGAYGIQDDTGALFVECISGDYYNVVGLPLRTLYRLVVSDFSDLLRG